MTKTVGIWEDTSLILVDLLARSLQTLKMQGKDSSSQRWRHVVLSVARLGWGRTLLQYWAAVDHSS